MRILLGIGFAVAASVGAEAQAVDQPVADPAEAGATADPALVELFISQACEASPPAASALERLAERPGVVALTWHVDYWNNMPSRKGVWRDPFSSDTANLRQLKYNERIRGRRMPITPQAVIDGAYTRVGAGIMQFEASYSAQSPAPRKERMLQVERSAGGSVFRARIDGAGRSYDALVVTFRPQTETEIMAGDNAGVTFRALNTVVGVEEILADADADETVAFAAPADGLDCAVLVQEHGQGRILDAAYCP